MNSDASLISPQLRELLLILLAWAFMAVLIGPALISLWRFWPPRAKVWPPQRQRLVTWTLLELALILLLFLFVLPILAQALLEPWFSPRTMARVHIGEIVLQEGSALSNGQLPVPAWVSATAQGILVQVRLARLDLAMYGLCGPFLVAAMIAILRWWQKPGALQMGLSLHRWRADLVAGFWGWLFIVPLCFTLFWVMRLPALEQVIGPTRIDPLEYLLKFGPTIGDWLLLIFVTVVVAPAAEEILVRGVFQPLMVRFPLLADSVVITALVFAIFMGLFRESQDNPWLPLLFLVGVGLGYLLFEWLMQPWLPRPGAARAIFAASLFFALLHLPGWPAPIPLFFLGLGLGFVAYRTQSLWGAILMHALFNLVNFVAQWFTLVMG